MCLTPSGTSRGRSGTFRPTTSLHPLPWHTTENSSLPLCLAMSHFGTHQHTPQLVPSSSVLAECGPLLSPRTVISRAVDSEMTRISFSVTSETSCSSSTFWTPLPSIIAKPGRSMEHFWVVSRGSYGENPSGGGCPERKKTISNKQCVCSSTPAGGWYLADNSALFRSIRA